MLIFNSVNLNEIPYLFSSCRVYSLVWRFLPNVTENKNLTAEGRKLFHKGSLGQAKSECLVQSCSDKILTDTFEKKTVNYLRYSKNEILRETP